MCEMTSKMFSYLRVKIIKMTGDGKFCDSKESRGYVGEMRKIVTIFHVMFYHLGSFWIILLVILGSYFMKCFAAV